MSGGGSAPAQPSTTTQIQDVPAWEQSYLQNVMGQAQTEAAQPYQPYTGPQVAGFTPDQLSAFSNIENMGSTYQPTQQAGLDSANAGAATAGNIYNAGAGDINASTGYNPLAAVSPYLGAASGYNAAYAAQPWLNQAAGYQGAAALAGTPQGIQSYMSPYTNDVVSGIQNEANQNWTQNIMPGVNDKFVGSGQYGSGRNAQVLGQAAGNFQTGLSANVANALESGYSTAGTQAANEANLLSGLGSQSLQGASTAGGQQTAQIGNLLNQAQAAGTAANQQASNLQSAGTALGNLTATQGQQQLAAGTTLGNLSQQQEQTGLQQQQALQAVGQQQQQLNQTNLNTAQQNFENAAQYPEQQTTFLDNIIRGINAGTSTTGSTQATPAYSVSPLSGIGGAGTGALSLLSGDGKSLGTAVSAKRGGLIKGYAAGGVVTTDDNDDDYDPTVDDDSNYSDYSQDSGQNPLVADSAPAAPEPEPAPAAVNPLMPQSASTINPDDLDTPDSQHNATAPDNMQYNGLTKADMQQQQLLALARGMLTPSLGGSGFAALGQGLGAAQDVATEQQKWNMEQQARNERLNLERENVNSEKDLRKWRMTQGVGAYDTIAKKLQADNPDLTYSQALTIARSRAEVPGRNSSIVASAPRAGKTIQPATSAPSGMANLLATDGSKKDGDFLDVVAPNGNPTKSSDAVTTLPVGEDDMKTNPNSYLNGSDGPIADAVNAKVPAEPMSGPLFIKGMEEKDPTTASLVKAVGDGDIKLSTVLAKAPTEFRQKIINAVRQYNPDYNENDYAGMVAFKQGKQGQALKPINTATEHLALLDPLVDALANGDVRAANAISNRISNEFGGVDISNFDAAKDLVASEVSKAAIGGVGGQEEREQLQAKLADAKSPAQLKGVMQQFRGLMGGQLTSTAQQYQFTTNKNDFATNPKILTPAARAIYQTYTASKQPAAGSNPSKVTTADELAATAQKYNKPIAQVRKDAVAAGYTIQ